jgi:hypothetical protein
VPPDEDRVEEVLSTVLRQAEAALAGERDPLTRIRGVGAILTTLETERLNLARLRAAAVRQLRVEGWSLGRIAQESGLSKARVAQIVRGP